MRYPTPAPRASCGNGANACAPANVLSAAAALPSPSPNPNAPPLPPPPPPAPPPLTPPPPLPPPKRAPGPLLNGENAALLPGVVEILPCGDAAENDERADEENEDRHAPLPWLTAAATAAPPALEEPLGVLPAAAYVVVVVLAKAMECCWPWGGAPTEDPAAELFLLLVAKVVAVDTEDEEAKVPMPGRALARRPNMRKNRIPTLERHEIYVKTEGQEAFWLRRRKGGGETVGGHGENEY